MIKIEPSLLVPAQKNELKPSDTLRDLAIENEFRGKEIDKVNINLNALSGDK